LDGTPPSRTMKLERKRDEHNDIVVSAIEADQFVAQGTQAMPSTPFVS
jgi:hypothetical protein